MSSPLSGNTTGPAVQPNPLPGQDDVSSQQHRNIQDSSHLADSDNHQHEPSRQLSKELHDSLPDRSRNTFVDDSLQPSQDFLYRIPLPSQSLQAAASLGPTSSSPSQMDLSQDPGKMTEPEIPAKVADVDEYPLLYYPPPIPGVNDNEVIYGSSTKRAKEQKYLFKNKNPSRNYSKHPSAHLVSPYQILAEIYDLEGKETGLREYMHELKDGKMCTYIMDMYRSHKIPGSKFPVSFSNLYPKAPPMSSTATEIDVTPYRHPRIRTSEKAAAAITTSVPELNSIDSPSIAPAGTKPPLNPLSTSLKWSTSKRKFDVFTSGTDAPPPVPSKMLKASADPDSDSLSDDSASFLDEHQPDTMPSKFYPYSLNAFGKFRICGPPCAAQRHQEDLEGESGDSTNEDRESTDETLSDDQDDEERDADDEEDDFDTEEAE